MDCCLGCIPKGGEDEWELESGSQRNLEIHCGRAVIKLWIMHDVICLPTQRLVVHSTQRLVVFFTRSLVVLSTRRLVVVKVKNISPKFEGKRR